MQTIPEGSKTDGLNPEMVSISETYERLELTGRLRSKTLTFSLFSRVEQPLMSTAFLLVRGCRGARTAETLKYSRRKNFD